MADNIFDGLEKYGVSSVAKKNNDIFANARTDSANKKDKSKFNIDEYLHAKKFVCPVCGQNFTSYVVRDNKVRMNSMDYDLRPIYTPVDPLYYDVVVCATSCGYSAVREVFAKITRAQTELILSEVSPKFRPYTYPKEPSIDLVIERYKLALLNAVVKKAKDGEKAYICMKLTWLYRIKGDDLATEKQFARLTLQGFTNALSKEFPPIMGLKQNTVLYLMGAFSVFLGEHDSALKILGEIIVSEGSSKRLKDKARVLRDTVRSEQDGIGVAQV